MKQDKPREHQEAVSRLLAANKQEPSDPGVCCQLARLQPEAADHWYRQAYRANPRCAEALVGLADCYWKADRFDHALQGYQAAQAQQPLGIKSLFRMGQALVHCGRQAEARDFLHQVLLLGNGSYKARTLACIALSHALDHNADLTLEYCQRAQDHLERHQDSAKAEELQAALGLRAVALLQLRELDSAASLLRRVLDGPGPSAASPWNETLQTAHCIAEVLQGDWRAAEAAFDAARVRCQSAEVLAAGAHLKICKGELDSAQELLFEALSVDHTAPSALLRMSQLLLIQEKRDQAVQFLQKCLKQSSKASLLFGPADRGLAHLYLCVALHERECRPFPAPVPPVDASPSSSYGRSMPWECKDSGSHSSIAPAARDHFRRAHELLPELRQRLGLIAPGVGTSLRSLAQQLLSGHPSRMGYLELTVEQGMAVLLYAAHCGVIPALDCLSDQAPSAACPDGIAKVQASMDPTLVGTASTAAPSSAMSRQGSNSALQPEISPSSTHDSVSLRLTAEHLIHSGDLELIECLSHGELTTVHRGTLCAAHSTSPVQVVIKSVHQKDCLNDPHAAEDLLAEINLLAELSHPRLVAFVGACLETQHIALVTELAPGGNLHHALHVRRHNFSRSDRFQLAQDMLEGVAYLHSCSPAVIHLDLKSLNLVFDAQGHLQICDFGLARALDGATTGRPSRGGSVRYMAPECHDPAFGSLSEKTDVWSAGCVLIEIFDSSFPYAQCGNVQQILKMILVQRSPPPVPESIEDRVRMAIQWSLAFAPKDRFTIQQVLCQLETIGKSS